MNLNFDTERFVAILRQVIGDERLPTSLHQPEFSGHELDYVTQCINEGWVSSVGAFVDRFERDLAEYAGVKRAVAVVNGTAALHICLILSDVKADDEVLLPAMTFVATANAVAYCNAVPHFVDSCEISLGVDVSKLEAYLQDIAEIRDRVCFNRLTGRRIKAFVPMHTFGHPVDMEPLLELCQRFHLSCIEDAAESLGSYYKGRHTGSFSSLSALSFNGNKIITTGGGGAILTNDHQLADRAKHITTTAKVSHRWNFEHDQLGYNYRMPNINAALGCAQLEQITDFLTRKRTLAERYMQAFKGFEGGRFFREPKFARSNYWLNAFILDVEHADILSRLLATTNDQGIMTRPAWKLMYRLPMYDQCPRMNCDTAERLERCIINLPSSAYLGESNGES